MSNDMYTRIQNRLKEIGDNTKTTIINGILETAPKLPNGSLGISTIKLNKIAELLMTSDYWLATGERDPYELKMSARHNFDHEKGSREEHDWDSAVETLKRPASVYTEIPILPESKKPYKMDGTPKEAAAFIRSALIDSCGEDFIERFPESIEKTFGIDVFVTKNGDKLEAYAGIICDNPFIVTNTSPEWYRLIFGLAHELGHLVANDLLPYSALDGTEGANEVWANYFASELLLPEEDMRSIDWNKITQEDIAIFIWKHGISLWVLKNRLQKLQLLNYIVELKISGRAADYIQDRVDKKSIAERCNFYTSEHFPARLIKIYRDAVNAGEIPGDTLAWMLGSDAESVEKSVNSVANTVSLLEEKYLATKSKFALAGESA